MKYFRRITIVGAVILALHLRILIMHEDDHRAQLLSDQLENGEHTCSVVTLGNYLMEQYGVPFAHYVVRVAYSVYVRLTIVNTTIFLLKSVPMGLYMNKYIKDMYVTYRKRIKQKQTDMEDIQLETQIKNEKLSVQEAKFSERAEQARRGRERLRKVRARVLRVIAADAALRRGLDGAAACNSDHDMHGDTPQQGDREFIVELLKELNEHIIMAIPERHSDKTEHSLTDPNTPEISVNSSVSDPDAKPDCLVKIVKVTNVFKVAYLKHYIKQKRLRRANKQALLKKKMEGIKKMLEDWQKRLNMVINSKLTILNIDPHPMGVASQDAMGDYSKPHESSDSDSDFRNSCTDMRYDEYSLSWAQNPYKPYTYNYEVQDVPETNRENYDTQDFGDVRYPDQPTFPCERGQCMNMMSIVEETHSQLAIEERKSESGEDYECRDLVVL